MFFMFPTAQYIHSTTRALAAAAEEMGARLSASEHHQHSLTREAQQALRARKVRVAGRANRHFRWDSKQLDDRADTAAVTAKQVRWAAAAVSQSALPDSLVFDALLCTHPLPAPGGRYDVMHNLTPALACADLSQVTVGDDVAVTVTTAVTAGAGLGLEFFCPGQRSSFQVALAHASGAAPVWLRASDVQLSITPAHNIECGCCAVEVSSTHATVFGWYEVPPTNPDPTMLDVLVQLTVCSVPVSPSPGWAVPRTATSHGCAALGVLKRAVAVPAGSKFGVAVSPDEKWLVVAMRAAAGEVHVYSLPSGDLVRTFGSVRGGVALRFSHMFHVCFSPSGTLLLVVETLRHVLEVTLDGEYVRLIAASDFNNGPPRCLAVREDLLAVGCIGTAESDVPSSVLLFSFASGELLRRFGSVGEAHGQLGKRCDGVCFSPDGALLAVAQWEPCRLSLFATATGEFVRLIDAGGLASGAHLCDVLLAATGAFVAPDPEQHRIRVFSSDGSTLLRVWEVEGDAPDRPSFPCALAAAGSHLYVLDRNSGRVLVYS